MRYVTWNVEEHLGGKKSEVGVGPATGIYETKNDALLAMCSAKTRGHGVTCIARSRDGAARLLILGLVPATR